MLSLYMPAVLASGDSSSSVEATTSISLPVDSVTIYPDGLMSVARTGVLSVTKGPQKFVLDVPSAADENSIILKVTNATIDRVVYDGNPVYSLNISSDGPQSFTLGYLMYSSGTWEPRYVLELENSSLDLSAQAIVQNNGGEDLKNVRLKLVAGLPSSIQNFLVSRAKSQIQMNYATETDAAAPPAPEDLTGSVGTGELETLFIFEIKDRTDLEMGKKIGLPLFEENVPVERLYTWDASSFENGPTTEEIRANNTMQLPWPAGTAMLYRNQQYVSTISMPYTATGTNASITVGSSPDLKVTKKLKDYNITEKIREVGSRDKGNQTVKETTEQWTYNLKIESNSDRSASLEVADSKPMEAKMLSVSPDPAETTATSLKWKLTLMPREKTAINYTYQIVTTQPLGQL